MNNNTLLHAEKWLNELGFKTQHANDSLMVLRDDIANWDEDDCLIGELKRAVSTKLFWGHQDDKWRHLMSF